MIHHRRRSTIYALPRFEYLYLKISYKDLVNWIFVTFGVGFWASEVSFGRDLMGLWAIICDFPLDSLVFGGFSTG